MANKVPLLGCFHTADSGKLSLGINNVRMNVSSGTKKRSGAFGHGQCRMFLSRSKSLESLLMTANNTYIGFIPPRNQMSLQLYIDGDYRKISSDLNVSPRPSGCGFAQY